MDPSIALTLCFIPLAVVVIGMKFLLLVEESGREIQHVHEESLRPHVYMSGVYDDVDEEEEDDDWT